MSEMDSTVAMQENTGMEQSADDAQATEISVEELVAQLTDTNAGEETVDNSGDDGHSMQEEPEEEQPKQDTGDKMGRRIAAALKSQKEQIFKDMGMSEAEVRELIRAHKAEQMHREDPEISPKAARKILEAQEKAKEPEVNPQVAELSAAMKDMLAKGWSHEEIKALVSDETVREDIANGKSLWQAARAYDRRQSQPQEPSKKRAVRTARSTAAGDSPEPDLIASIPEDKYDSFMEELRRRAMRGEKVRI